MLGQDGAQWDVDQNTSSGEALWTDGWLGTKWIGADATPTPCKHILAFISTGSHQHAVISFRQTIIHTIRAVREPCMNSWHPLATCLQESLGVVEARPRNKQEVLRKPSIENRNNKDLFQCLSPSQVIVTLIHGHGNCSSPGSTCSGANVNEIACRFELVLGVASIQAWFHGLSWFQWLRSLGLVLGSMSQCHVPICPR